MRFHWMHRFDFGNSEKDLTEMAVVLENHNVNSILLTYSYRSPDYVISLPSMIKATSKIKFMLALRPYTLSPEYAARMFRTISENYGDRMTLNLVAGKMGEKEEEDAIEMYNLDPTLINTIESRINLLENWADKFFKIMKFRRPTSYTIANSPITFEIGNRLTDYVIFQEGKLEAHTGPDKKTKPVLTIDPLIRETKKELDEDIEYYVQAWKPILNKPSIIGKQHHYIQGSMENVKQQIRDISKKYGVEDFMICTSQKDISQILKLIKEMSLE